MERFCQMKQTVNFQSFVWVKSHIKNLCKEDNYFLFIKFSNLCMLYSWKNYNFYFATKNSHRQKKLFSAVYNWKALNWYNSDPVVPYMLLPQNHGVALLEGSSRNHQFNQPAQTSISYWLLRIMPIWCLTISRDVDSTKTLPWFDHCHSNKDFFLLFK